MDIETMTLGDLPETHAVDDALLRVCLAWLQGRPSIERAVALGSDGLRATRRSSLTED